MTIIAIGSAQVVREVQRKQERHDEPSKKLLEDMRATAADTTFETWNDHAAEIHKVGYVSVWPVVFDQFGKYCPKNMTALKLKVVAGAVEECKEKFSSKHYFEGKNLDRTMKRIGAIYLLALKMKRENHVRFAFAPILSGHGIDVPDYLKPQIAVAAVAQPKREERGVRRPVERQSRAAVEMFKHAPEPAKIAVRADGTSYLLKAKHKAIVALTAEEREAREKQRLAEKAAADKKKAEQAQKAAQLAKEKSKNKGGRPGGKK